MTLCVSARHPVVTVCVFPQLCVSLLVPSPRIGAQQCTYMPALSFRRDLKRRVPPEGFALNPSQVGHSLLYFFHLPFCFSCVYICVFVHMHVHVCACVHMVVYVRAHAHVCLCMYTHVSVRACLCVCLREVNVGYLSQSRFTIFFSRQSLLTGRGAH